MTPFQILIFLQLYYNIFFSFVKGLSFFSLVHLKGGTKMENNKDKKTSDAVATKASEILRDDRYSEKSKSVAGSALSQHPSKKN